MAGKVKESNTLTVSAAIIAGRLQEFAAQAEANGVGPIEDAEFESDG